MENQINAEQTAQNYRYQLDPEIAEGLADFMNGQPEQGKAEKGDWQTLRKMGNELYTHMNERLPHNPHVLRNDYNFEAKDGFWVSLRWFWTPAVEENSAAVVFVHGGGRLFGSVELYDRVVADYVNRSNVPFLSVDYGLAPETHGKAQAEQVLEAILWLKENAETLGIDTERIAVMGDSGGGGIAAGAAILARDRNISLAKQILIYPMLDHRVKMNEPIEPLSAFGYQEMVTLWQAALGPDNLSEYELMVASPARLNNFEGLAPAYLSIGDIDYFRNENLDYARKLAEAAVPLEFHLYPGTPHGFEIFTPETEIAERAMDTHVGAIKSI